MEPTLIKEGWLLKRGEHIKTWRDRYFYLYSDGSFIGFKRKPTAMSKCESLNSFDIRRSQVLASDKPKKNCFIIRCLQSTTLIERIFSSESLESRDEWVKKIKEVADDYINIRKHTSRSSQYVCETRTEKESPTQQEEEYHKDD